MHSIQGPHFIRKVEPIVKYGMLRIGVNQQCAHAALGRCKREPARHGTFPISLFRSGDGNDMKFLHLLAGPIVQMAEESETGRDLPERLTRSAREGRGGITAAIFVCTAS